MKPQFHLPCGFLGEEIHAGEGLVEVRLDKVRRSSINLVMVERYWIDQSLRQVFCMGGFKTLNFFPLVMALVGLLLPPWPLEGCCCTRPAPQPTSCCCCLDSNSPSPQTKSCCQNEIKTPQCVWTQPDCSCEFRSDDTCCFLRKLRFELAEATVRKIELPRLIVGKSFAKTSFTALDYATPSKQILYCTWLD